MAPNIEHPTVIAEYPLDDSEPESADIILCTPDGVQFFANKAVLSMVSPVFRDMLSLPAPSTPNGHRVVSTDRPCVHVQDISKELFQLLSWCNPRGALSHIFDSFKAALKLSDKYGMDRVIQRIAKAIELNGELVKKDCVRVYAIAIRYQLTQIAEAAA